MRSLTSPSRATVKRLIAATVLGCVTAPLLAACGSDDVAVAGPTSSGRTHRHSDSVPPVWPLTGEPVAAGQTAVLPRPVLVVKMDNTASSAPQIGLSSADLVVEELVEGGITRLAAMYYEHLPARVGPVRSMRASDIGIVTPVGASLVTSGAASPTIARLHAAGVHYFNENNAGFARDGSRYAPYNLFADLRTVGDAAQHKPARPDDYLPWATDASAFPTSSPMATSIHATFSSGHTTDWAYRAGHYVNTDSNAAADDQFSADNVLVIGVREGTAGYLDPAGNPVPEAHFTGTGAALLFHGGHAVNARWHKRGLGGRLTLTVGKSTLKVPPGHTWIELLPDTTGHLTYSG